MRRNTNHLLTKTVMCFWITDICPICLTVVERSTLRCEKADAGGYCEAERTRPGLINRGTGMLGDLSGTRTWTRTATRMTTSLSRFP